MTAKHKPAGITSREEAQRRMKAGEVFYFGIGSSTSRTRIRYDEDFIRLGESPFRYGGEALKDVWDLYERWNVEVVWYRNLQSQGVLCWVSDVHSEPANGSGKVAIVKKYQSDSQYPFRLQGGSYYRYAAPLTQAELTYFGDTNGDI